VGDTVNLASRLERLNEQFGTDVLISADTRAAIADEFVCREVGRTTVRGRTQATTVYELVGRRSDAGDAVSGSVAAIEEPSG
jgi:adenylate cyclase